MTSYSEVMVSVCDEVEEAITRVEPQEFRKSVWLRTGKSPQELQLGGLIGATRIFIK